MNIHFSELLVILVIALLVIKPERLPEVAHAIGRWIKRLRQIVNKVKHDIQSHE